MEVGGIRREAEEERGGRGAGKKWGREEDVYGGNLPWKADPELVSIVCDEVVVRARYGRRGLERRDSLCILTVAGRSVVHSKIYCVNTNRHLYSSSPSP